MNRREFLQQTGVAAGVLAAGGYAPSLARATDANGDGTRCVIVRDPADRIASEAPVEWAISRLREALAARHVAVTPAARFEDVPADAHCVVVAGKSNAIAAKLGGAARVTLAESSESTAVAPFPRNGGSRL